VTPQRKTELRRIAECTSKLVECFAIHECLAYIDELERATASTARARLGAWLADETGRYFDRVHDTDRVSVKLCDVTQGEAAIVCDGPYRRTEDEAIAAVLDSLAAADEPKGET
jgi:hypothetical protein